MNKAIYALALLFAVCILCGCSVKSPDMYKAGGARVASLTAVCGEKKLKSVGSAGETDDVRRQIYAQTVKYAYDEITAEDIDKYQKRLIKDGFHVFGRYCYQTTTDKDGFFTEVRIDKEQNAVFVSRGSINP